MYIELFYSVICSVTVSTKFQPIIFAENIKVIEADRAVVNWTQREQSTNIKHKGLQRAANEYAEESRIYKDLISKNNNVDMLIVLREN